jgi:phosphoglucosamine mutase
MTDKKYFGTDGIRGRVGEAPVTAEFILKLGWAVGSVLAKEGHGKVLIGKDTRVSGYMFEAALEAGLAAAGVDVRLLGPLPTPAIAYLTRTQRASAGVVISASHNLYEDNGIKFFSSRGYKLDDALELEIEAMLDQPMTTTNSDSLGKAVRVDDAPGRYIEYCKSTVSSEINFDGIKVVLDCANGATYHVAPSVFIELGAEVTLLGVDPNGYNINLNCGSTHTDRLKTEVMAQGADLGIAFDGDGDRVVMVDEHGEVVDGDELLFVLTKFRHEMQIHKGGVVGTLMSNMGLERALKDRSIPFVRTKVGDRYVMESLLENGWRVGGEQSGHIICLDHGTTGDGIIAALQVLSVLAFYQKSLGELKQGMNKLPQILVNVKLKEKKDVMTIPSVQSAVAEAEKELAETGRVLMRPSGTEPVMRVMVEGEDRVKVEAIVERLANVIREEAS